MTGMENQGPAGEAFHLSLLMKILPHCDSEGVHGGADLMGFNPDKYPVQRVRQATLDDEPRRVLFQIRKRVFPCLPTCKIFLEKVKVLALMLCERDIHIHKRDVKRFIDKFHEPQGEGSAFLHRSPFPDIRINNSNSVFRLLNPADGEIVGAELPDRNADMVGAGIHNLREKRADLFGKSLFLAVRQIPVKLEL